MVNESKTRSSLEGPDIDPTFKSALDELVATARKGHKPGSEFFNPSDQWLVDHMEVFQDLPGDQQEALLNEFDQINQEGAKVNAEGKAARRAGPEAVFKLDSGGLAFYSQNGVTRRPDLTQYFIDGFIRNRDAIAFSEENQALFAEVLPYITDFMQKSFDRGDTIVQSDRQICDAADRSYHARQLVFGTRYLQMPYCWRQLTFDLPENQRSGEPDILEVSIPTWLEILGLPENLKTRLMDIGITQLIFKAPTKGLSLHLGFDYVGEHKMGPLTIAMYKVKEANGLALQAALSVARVKTLDGKMNHVATVTAGPSLHGKSTITIMIELTDSDLAKALGLQDDPQEGIYPMNDDIILIQPLAKPVRSNRDPSLRIAYSIDGTENNFYAVPTGLTREDDAIQYDALRGTPDSPNPQETLENVPVDPRSGRPDFMQNPTRNMRMILSRTRLLERKGAQPLLSSLSGGRLKESVHVPMEDMDRVLWQAVMRQNTVVPPLRRLTMKQYVRVLMYGEAVQMGAATGAIGRPYVEYFSDPFIMGLEDENANLMYYILQQLERDGLEQEFYTFNTGGLGAETNDEASGPRYKKIAREVTLMLQEALMRKAVKFEHDSILGSDVAVAIIDKDGKEVRDLREWLPQNIYGAAEYEQRVDELLRRRYYGKDASDKAGILRYTKVTDSIIDIADIPVPSDERELAWLLSYFWHVDSAYSTLVELAAHSTSEGMRPAEYVLRALQRMYDTAQGIQLSSEGRSTLSALGLK